MITHLLALTLGFVGGVVVSVYFPGIWGNLSAGARDVAAWINDRRG